MAFIPLVPLSRRSPLRFVEHEAKLAGHVSRRSLVGDDDSSSSHQEKETRETRERLGEWESLRMSERERGGEWDRREKGREGKRQRRKEREKENSCVPIPVRAKQRWTENRTRTSLYVCKYSRADQAKWKRERESEKERERERDGRKAKTINKIAGSEGARARIRRVASVLLARDHETRV